MFDIENDIFDTISKALKEIYPNITVNSDYLNAPSTFPAVSIQEVDNFIVKSMRTINVENANQIVYEINVFSNKTVGKQSEAKKILNSVDEILTNLNFTRTMKNVIPNFNNATIFRIAARYEAKIGLAELPNTYFIYQTN